MHKKTWGRLTFLLNLMFSSLDKFDGPIFNGDYLQWGTYIQNVNWVTYLGCLYLGHLYIGGLLTGFYGISFSFFFFGFICLFKRRMLINAGIIFFFLKSWSDSTIWKIWCSFLKLKIRRPMKYSDSSDRVHQLIIRATVLGISIQSFMLWLPSRTDQFPPPITANNIYIYIYIYIYIHICMYIYICIYIYIYFDALLMVM